MRILSARGKLYNVTKVQPLVEKMEVFNGTSHYNREIAKDMSVKPTCLEFCTRGMMEDVESFTVGNLPFEKVQEIQNTMLEKGYYDFSKMEYQPEDARIFSKLKIDGGVSLPYFNEVVDSSIFTTAHNMFSLPPGNRMSFDEDED